MTAPARSDQRAHIIALTSPYSGVGTSYTARQLALLAAKFYVPHGFRVLLIDFDLEKQSQSDYFSDPGTQAIFGDLTGPYDLTYGLEPFWRVSPDFVDQAGTRHAAGNYAGAYMVGDSGLVISKFDWSQIKDGQKVHTLNNPAYWDALRDNFALILIDTPAFDRSNTGHDVYEIADKSVIICDPNRSQNTAITDLSAQISQAGGMCSGLIVNAGPPNITPQIAPATAPVA